jgi:hypothetical protein
MLCLPSGPRLTRRDLQRRTDMLTVCGPRLAPCCTIYTSRARDIVPSVRTYAEPRRSLDLRALMAPRRAATPLRSRALMKRRALR